MKSPETGRRKAADQLFVHMIYAIYLLTATGLTPGGSSTVHIYTKTIHRTTQLATLVGRLSGIQPRVVTPIGKSAGRAPHMKGTPLPEFSDSRISYFAFLVDIKRNFNYFNVK